MYTCELGLLSQCIVWIEVLDVHRLIIHLVSFVQCLMVERALPFVPLVIFNRL